MSVVPQQHRFNCTAAPDIDVLTVNISKMPNGLHPQPVLFAIGESSVFIDEREQVTLIRDMLTVWLSRNHCSVCGGAGRIKPDVDLEACVCAKGR